MKRADEEAFESEQKMHPGASRVTSSDVQYVPMAMVVEPQPEQFVARAFPDREKYYRAQPLSKAGVKEMMRQRARQETQFFQQFFPQAFDLQKLGNIFDSVLTEAEGTVAKDALKKMDLCVDWESGQHQNCPIFHMAEDAMYRAEIHWGKFNRPFNVNPHGFVCALDIRMSNDGFRYPGIRDLPKMKTVYEIPEQRHKSKHNNFEGIGNWWVLETTGEGPFAPFHKFAASWFKETEHRVKIFYNEEFERIDIEYRSSDQKFQLCMSFEYGVPEPKFDATHF